MSGFKLREWIAKDGRNPFNLWLRGLRDVRRRARIRARLDRVSLIGALRDPAEAAAYLAAAPAAGGRPAFLMAIRNVIKASGGMTQIARKTGLNRENLYRLDSE